MILPIDVKLISFFLIFDNTPKGIFTKEIFGEQYVNEFLKLHLYALNSTLKWMQTCLCERVKREKIFS